MVGTEYFYEEEDKRSKGNATIDFDRERFLEVFFNKILSKSERNLDLASMNIEVENVHTPFGVKYVHEYDDVGSIVSLFFINIFQLLSSYNLFIFICL